MLSTVVSQPRSISILILYLAVLIRSNIPHRQIDLRSDTVTRPTLQMRQAMAEALVGDDVFGDDPTVIQLETKISKMFDKEASLFFPTGTMSNLAATMSWCGSRGSEMIVGDESHIYIYEQGGSAQIAGVSSRALPNLYDGTIDIDRIKNAIRSSNIHFPVTELLSLENTHNMCGGKCLPMGYLAAVSEVTKSRGIPIHLDGARIWNAASATGELVADLTAQADSISVCLSKGLGAPAGSLLIGTKLFIDKARRIRKVLGGGMRQVGVLAAAGMQAVQDFESGILISDHRRAKRLGEGIALLPGFSLDVIDTNILLVHIERSIKDWDAKRLFEALRQCGLLCLVKSSRALRLVVHRDITDSDIEIALQYFNVISKQMCHESDATGILIEPIVTSTDSSKVSESSVFEPVHICGASVSEEGFLVFLKSQSLDRVVKIRVTPSDPMTDGLDREQVESQEAVTLLQLLQGIDVESYLPSDTLSHIMLAPDASSSGQKSDKKNKKRSSSSIEKSKDSSFEEKLSMASDGSNSQGTSETSIAASQHVTVNLNKVTINHAPVSADSNEVFVCILRGTITHSIHVNAEAPATDTGATQPIQNFVSISEHEKEARLTSAFESLALSLRHGAPLEINNLILHDENVSYSSSELKTFYPQLIEVGPFAQ